MTNAEFKLFMANLKSANLAQAAKNDLKELLEVVQEKSMEAISSDNRIEKDAVIMGNLVLIKKLIDEQIKLIDQTQKVNMSISGIIADVVRKSKEDDSTDGKEDENDE
jgi:uncharacterized membrane protein